MAIAEIILEIVGALFEAAATNRNWFLFILAIALTGFTIWLVFFA